ncbi:MAG: arsenate reductase (glutaredoxin) [Gammaproteobacteria bacterium]|nr:MAG: arsenate reductase (glutaredoxin) [Gammaproteobacteria bacterium]
MTEEKLTIYHNPGCSKSRETLNILKQHGKSPEIIEYLKNPPGTHELKRIVDLLDLSPREILRTGEPAYQDAKPGDNTINDENILAAICEYPSLLQRPIVVMGNRAVIGRPPVRVLDLFS